MRGDTEYEVEQEEQGREHHGPENPLPAIPHTLTPFTGWAGRLLRASPVQGPKCSIAAPSDFVNPAGRLFRGSRRGQPYRARGPTGGGDGWTAGKDG